MLNQYTTNRAIVDFCHLIAAAGPYMTVEEALFAGSISAQLAGTSGAFVDPHSVAYNAYRHQAPFETTAFGAGLTVRAALYTLEGKVLLAPAHVSSLHELAARLEGRGGVTFFPPYV